MALLLSTSGQRIGDMMCNTTVVRLTRDQPEHYEELLEAYQGEPDKNRIGKVFKIFGIVAGLFVALVLALILLVTSVMKNSGAYDISIAEIESSMEIREEIGQITGYGFIPTGSINTSNGYGEASLVIKVKGEKGDIHVATYCLKEPREEWVIEEFEILQR